MTQNNDTNKVESNIIIEEKISPICSDKDEENSSNDGCNQSHICVGDLSKSNVSEFDSNSLEKKDKKRVNIIRTKFY